ncbi:MAG: AAA family ATPase [Pseudomonadota bacterium]
MKYPYGICDFGTIIQEDYFYIDRTGLIPLLEDIGRQLMFLRPRRFGKSLLLSMLEYYYDLARADTFAQTFGRLAIGQAPTEEHSQYVILKWDFSMVASQGDLNDLRSALYNHINGEIQACADRYASYLQRPVILQEDAIASLRSLLNAVEQSDHKLYLLIDEYDNFANEIAMGSRQHSKTHYEGLLQGEGLLKTLFKAVKAAASGRGLERVFITGVSPMVLSDLTSGYNVAKSLSMEPELAALCGFTEPEVAQTLAQMQQNTRATLPDVAESLTLMRTFYNGYRFSEQTDTQVYNPTLTLYFLEHIDRHHRYPGNMLDENLAMDRGKLAYIATLPEGAQLIEATIEQQQPLIVDTLLQRFGIEDLLYGEKDRAFMLSLLYFFGILTLQGTNLLGRLKLAIPNLVTRELYVRQLRARYFPGADWNAEVLPVIEAFYQQGDLEGVCALVRQRAFAALDNRDSRQINELTIKTAFLILISDDLLYEVDSERRVGRGYADLTLIIRPDARKYPIFDFLLEFKYVSLKQLGLTSEAVQQLSVQEAKQLPPVATAFAEARKQLEQYAEALQARQGKSLKLRSYAIVSIGLVRILWTESGREKLVGDDTQ